MNRKKKSLSERLTHVSYLQAAFTLLAVSAVMTVFCLWRAIASDGTVGILTAITGILAFFAAGAGAFVTLYGRFEVEAKSKTHWLYGFIPNLLLAVSYIVLYVIGALT